MNSNIFQPDMRNGGGKLFFKSLRQKHIQTIQSIKPTVKSLQRPHSHINTQHKSRKQEICFQMNEFQIVKKTFETIQNIKSRVDTSEPKFMKARLYSSLNKTLSNIETSRQHSYNCSHITSSLKSFEKEIQLKKQQMKKQTEQREIYNQNNSLHFSQAGQTLSKVFVNEKDSSQVIYLYNPMTNSRSFKQYSKKNQNEISYIDTINSPMSKNNTSQPKNLLDGNLVNTEESIYLNQKNFSIEESNSTKQHNKILIKKENEKEQTFLNQESYNPIIKDQIKIYSLPQSTKNKDKYHFFQVNIQQQHHGQNEIYEQEYYQSQSSREKYNDPAQPQKLVGIGKETELNNLKIKQRPYSATPQISKMITITENDQIVSSNNEAQNKNMQATEEFQNSQLNQIHEKEKSNQIDMISKISLNNHDVSNNNLTQQNHTNKSSYSYLMNSSANNYSMRSLKAKVNAYWGGVDYHVRKNPYVEQQKKQDINYDFQASILNQQYKKLLKKIPRLHPFDMNLKNQNDLRRYILNIIVDYGIYNEIEIQALARVVYTHNLHLDKTKIIECCKSLAKEILKNTQSNINITNQNLQSAKEYRNQMILNGDSFSLNKTITTNESTPKFITKQLPIVQMNQGESQQQFEKKNSNTIGNIILAQPK